MLGLVQRAEQEEIQVAIFSSETRRWTSVESEWPYKTVLLGGTACAYLNGTMHLTTHHGTIVTVDSEGKAWREIEDVMEDNREVVSIGHSQGSLHAWLIDNDKDPELCVWVLEDYASGKWTLKHTVEISELFGRQTDKDEACYSMLAIHPDCNLVHLMFLVLWKCRQVVTESRCCFHVLGVEVLHKYQLLGMSLSFLFCGLAWICLKLLAPMSTSVCSSYLFVFRCVPFVALNITG
ncbi:hypothetical protein ACQJBY_058682 [Aegilops geniculata]